MNNIIHKKLKIFTIIYLDNVRIPSVWFFYYTIVSLSKNYFFTVIIANLRFLAFCSIFQIAIWLNIEEVMSD